MNSNADSQMPARPPSVVILEVKNQGHVPSFKTNKSAIVNRQTGKPMVVTQKQHRKWMKACTANFVFQLCSRCQTIGAETWTAESLRSLIALLPPDDAWQIISELKIKVERVQKGQEGATILIERIPAVAIQPQ